MVFGQDMVENATALTGIVGNVEIVLFHTPELDNIPSPQQIRSLKHIAERSGIRFTVHLPASLEIASADDAKRAASICMVQRICARTRPLDPLHYILHVPFTAPTLAPVPGLYFKSGDAEKWEQWTQRGLHSLRQLRRTLGPATDFLVENINYSPCFLEPFRLEEGCGLCLDIGHLLLGEENVDENLQTYAGVVREIHLHGVRGYEEHISLSVLPEAQVRRWLSFLLKAQFTGVLNFEVFTPQDLISSLNLAYEALGVDPLT